MCALSGELTIDLGALAYNYNLLDRKTGRNCLTAPAVKADSYGVGMAQAAPVFARNGARQFFTATLEEAIALRQILPDAEIAVLNGFASAFACDYTGNNLIPVLNSYDDIKACGDYARHAEGRISVFLHFDTGMNRLGIGAGEAGTIFAHMDCLDGLDVDCIMSHFACADEKNHPMNEMQWSRFQKIAQHFPNAKKSMANSSAIFRSQSYHFDIARPGLALYGGNPVPESVNPMRSVVGLQVPVLQIHTAAKGETAGYNATYRFNENAMLAVVSVGYADGFFRSCSNRAKLYWKGYPLPVRGRVSMDLVICDLLNVPEGDRPKPYDMVEVIGAHQSLEQLAEDAGTISYEILTSLGRRYRRLYINES